MPAGKRKIISSIQENDERKASQLQESTSRFLRKRLEREGIKGSAVATFNIKKEGMEGSLSTDSKRVQEILERFRSSLFKQE